MAETLPLVGSVFERLFEDFPSQAAGNGIPGKPGGKNAGKTTGPRTSTSLFSFSTTEETDSSDSFESGPGKGARLFGSPESIALGVEGFDDLPPYGADPMIFGGGEGASDFGTSDLIGSEPMVISSDPDILDVGGMSSDIGSDEPDLDVFKGKGRGRG